MGLGEPQMLYKGITLCVADPRPSQVDVVCIDFFGWLHSIAERHRETETTCVGVARAIAGEILSIVKGTHESFPRSPRVAIVSDSPAYNPQHKLAENLKRKKAASRREQNELEKLSDEQKAQLAEDRQLVARIVCLEADDPGRHLAYLFLKGGARGRGIVLRFLKKYLALEVGPSLAPGEELYLTGFDEEGGEAYRVRRTPLHEAKEEEEEEEDQQDKDQKEPAGQDKDDDEDPLNQRPLFSVEEDDYIEPVPTLGSTRGEGDICVIPVGYEIISQAKFDDDDNNNNGPRSIFVSTPDTDVTVIATQHARYNRVAPRIRIFLTQSSRPGIVVDVNKLATWITTNGAEVLARHPGMCTDPFLTQVTYAHLEGCDIFDKILTRVSPFFATHGPNLTGTKAFVVPVQALEAAVKREEPSARVTEAFLESLFADHRQRQQPSKANPEPDRVDNVPVFAMGDLRDFLQERKSGSFGDLGDFVELMKRRPSSTHTLSCRMAPWFLGKVSERKREVTGDPSVQFIYFVDPSTQSALVDTIPDEKAALDLDIPCALLCLATVLELWETKSTPPGPPDPPPKKTRRKKATEPKLKRLTLERFHQLMRSPGDATVAESALIEKATQGSVAWLIAHYNEIRDHLLLLYQQIRYTMSSVTNPLSKVDHVQPWHNCTIDTTDASETRVFAAATPGSIAFQLKAGLGTRLCANTRRADNDNDDDDDDKDDTRLSPPSLKRTRV